MTHILDITDHCFMIRPDLNKFNGKYVIKGSILDWMRENFKEDNWSFAEYSGGILFHADEDAMAFKLRWL